MAWDFKSRSSVYSQIVDKLRFDILSGKYLPGQQLPSVRNLAMEAGVNPNTMQRALLQLENEHLFVTKGTLGRFVTEDPETITKAAKREKDRIIECLLTEANSYGLKNEDILDYLRDEKQ